jgi:hypothetical protein
MESCKHRLELARIAVIAAAGQIGLSIVFLGLAIAANAGFFTAVAAVGFVAVAAGFALTAFGSLAYAVGALIAIRNAGCIPQECAHEYSSLVGVITLAAGATLTLFATILATAPVAAIPWFAQPVLWAVLFAVIALAATITSLAKFFTPLIECLDRVARSRGPLEYGEKASDPWLLRLKPVEGSKFAVPLDGSTAIVEEDYIHDTFVRCSRVSVGQWQIRAVAWIIAPAEVRVEFTWSLDGKPLGGTVTADGRRSVLTHIIPASTALEHTLRVDAKDKGGFARTKQAVAEVGETASVCKVWVALLQPERKSPAVPWTDERLGPALSAFYRAVDEIERGTPVSDIGHAPIDRHH